MKKVNRWELLVFICIAIASGVVMWVVWVSAKAMGGFRVRIIVVPFVSTAVLSGLGALLLSFSSSIREGFDWSMRLVWSAVAAIFGLALFLLLKATELCVLHW